MSKTQKRHRLSSALRRSCLLALLSATTAIAANPPEQPPAPEQQAAPEQPPGAEQIVAERAQARWDALLAGKPDAAYEFLTPAFRGTTPPERYRSRFGGSVNWLAATVDSVNCEESRCRVVVMLTYRFAKERLENTRPLFETWIESDGGWWLYLEK